METYKIAAKMSNRWGRATMPTIAAVAVIAGLVLGAVVIIIWHSLGQADKVSRRSELLMIALYLNEHAKKHGSYPNDLAWAVHEARVGLRVDLKGLEYVASGKPYDARANQLLFYEKEPRRYGFERGCFAIYQNDMAIYTRDAPDEKGAPGVPVPPRA